MSSTPSDTMVVPRLTRLLEARGLPLALSRAVSGVRGRLITGRAFRGRCAELALPGADSAGLLGAASQSFIGALSLRLAFSTELGPPSSSHLLSPMGGMKPLSEPGAMLNPPSSPPSLASRPSAAQPEAIASPLSAAHAEFCAVVGRDLREDLASHGRPSSVTSEAPGKASASPSAELLRTQRGRPLSRTH